MPSEYLQMSKKMRELAEMPILIIFDITSEEIGDVEITVSSWRSKEDVMDWAHNPEHIEAKEIQKNGTNGYVEYMEAVDEKGDKYWDYSRISDSEIVNVFILQNTATPHWEELKQKIQLLQQVEMDNTNPSIVNLYNDRNIEWVQYVRNMGHKYAPFWFDGC